MCTTSASVYSNRIRFHQDLAKIIRTVQMDTDIKIQQHGFLFYFCWHAIINHYHTSQQQITK